jgi:hypothetical protein
MLFLMVAADDATGPMKESHFYRLHCSCRPAALARMRCGEGAADTAGRPVRVRSRLWRRGALNNQATRRLKSPRRANILGVSEFFKDLEWEKNRFPARGGGSDPRVPKKRDFKLTHFRKFKEESISWFVHFG